MGLVTVFSIDGCPHCARAKNALKERSIPFVEINLSSYPDKRSDMLSLSNSLTVPQIFFNDRHVGGATETIALLEDWDEGKGSALEMFKNEVKAEPDPTDARLKPSTKPPAQQPEPPSRDPSDDLILPTSERITVLEVTLRLMKAVPTEDLFYGGKTYKNAATGKTFHKAIMDEFHLDDDKALEFGFYLQKRRIIHHVTWDHEYSNTADLYFRLQPDQTPNVLNSFRIWTENANPDAVAIVSRLSTKMNGLQSRATLASGHVDLGAASNDKEYAEFEEEVCELQGVSMLGMDISTKTAFIINLYNLMIKYAQMKIGVPGSNWQRSVFFTKFNINIGEDHYTFNELENGILRANAPPPYTLWRLFKPEDKRMKHSLERVDPRIHFALNCGARSCPPVKKFTSQDLEEELRIVALAFCEKDDNVRIDALRKEIHLNMIFNWYRPDFAASKGGLAKALIRFTRGEKRAVLEKLVEEHSHRIKVNFNIYDWSSNISNSKAFDSSVLNADEFVWKRMLCSCG